MTVALLSSAAFAADDPSLLKVKMRGSDKAGYSRIVFDWGAATNPSQVAYKTEELSDRVVIRFEGKVDLSSDSDVFKSLSRVTDYKIISSNHVEIAFIKGQTVRYLPADNRLIIDIKGDPVQKPALSSSERLLAESQPVDLASRIETAAGDGTDQKHGSAALPAAPEGAPESVAVPASTGSYDIVITSTTAIPLAVFERNRYLWIVQGKENIKLQPQLTSHGGQALQGFEPIPSSMGVSVFRVQIPENMNISATGGGLVWKLRLQTEATSKSDSQSFIPYQKISDIHNVNVKPGIRWPASGVSRVVEIKDPDAEDTITVGLVDTAKDFTGGLQSFVDFESLPAFVGLAVLPKIDDLKVTKTDGGIVLSREKGLNLASDQDIMTVGEKTKPQHHEIKDESPADTSKELSQIYDFKSWQVGDKKTLSSNQRLMMAAMGNQTNEKKAEGLIGLAKLSLSFNYAPEAIGYLDLAQEYVPEIESNPEFMALMGAAEALSWKQKDAYQIFSHASLNDIADIPYWKAFTLAKLDDWQQAARILPSDHRIIAGYSDDIKTPIGLTLVEIALREGNLPKAKGFFDVLEPLRDHMDLPYASAYDYLKGEMDRQGKKPEEAKAAWKGLSDAADDLYRAKARFALTMMQLDAKEITEDKAIDNLEGLRYAWRGDDLEVSINYNLAKIYLMKNEPVKALTMMQLAYSLNPSSEQGKKINADMHEAFKALFLPEKIKTISPVDILILYNEFANLLPPGDEGAAITRQLAERMATADLLPRAIALLKKQVDDGLKGLEGASVAIRLATLQNMDMKPDDALVSLDKAENFMKGLPSDVDQDVLAKQEDIGLLRAKAYSLKGKPDEAFAALALLPQDEQSLKLRADIAWRAKKWQDAADSLEQLIQNQNITLTRPLTDPQAELLLNWAVALYLADNRYVLANVRERYSDAMSATPKARKFEVVTRPRQSALLADRETINSIIDEASIFKDFLTSFKTADTVEKPLVAPASPNDEASSPSSPAGENVPQALRNLPGLKTDEVLGD